MWRYNGTGWENISSTVNVAGNFVNATGITNFSVFAVGEAAVAPTPAPPARPGGSGSWLGPTEAMLAGFNCSNGLIEGGETCENCREDYDAVYGEEYCEAVIAKAGLEEILIFIGALFVGLIAFLVWDKEREKDQLRKGGTRRKLKIQERGRKRVSRRKVYQRKQRYPRRRWGRLSW
jgi:hypothetical protein